MRISSTDQQGKHLITIRSRLKWNCFNRTCFLLYTARTLQVFCSPSIASETCVKSNSLSLCFQFVLNEHVRLENRRFKWLKKVREGIKLKWESTHFSNILHTSVSFKAITYVAVCSYCCLILFSLVVSIQKRLPLHRWCRGYAGSSEIVCWRLENRCCLWWIAEGFGRLSRNCTACVRSTSPKQIENAKDSCIQFTVGREDAE